MLPRARLLLGSWVRRPKPRSLSRVRILRRRLHEGLRRRLAQSPGGCSTQHLLLGRLRLTGARRCLRRWLLLLLLLLLSSC